MTRRERTTVLSALTGLRKVALEAKLRLPMRLRFLYLSAIRTLVSEKTKEARP